jgi:hypothetical protein
MRTTVAAFRAGRVVPGAPAPPVPGRPRSRLRDRGRPERSVSQLSGTRPGQRDGRLLRRHHADQLGADPAAPYERQGGSLGARPGLRDSTLSIPRWQVGVTDPAQRIDGRFFKG